MGRADYLIVLTVENTDIPLPHVQRIEDVEKLFLPVEIKTAFSRGSC